MWKYVLFRYLLAFLLVTAGGTVYHLMTVSGEQSDPRFVLLRLEDIGPGGQYDSVDKLGKLRAVLEYLGDEGVHYHLGVIPKWVNYSENGEIYNRSIDQTDDEYVAALVRLLHQAEGNGGIVGMHGYTHQVGETKRTDGQQETGIGNEFSIAGLPETDTLEYADNRIREGLKLFRAAEITPDFWETPHYHTSSELQKVFRSYFGLIYENVPENPNQPAMQFVKDGNQRYGAASLASAYIPTPFSFIPYNRDERLILDQLGKSNRIPSFFYHPFLEFKHLLPVYDENGNQEVRDGLPEYRYPDKNRSNLQKLVSEIKERGYKFYSIHDYIPFTPGRGVNLVAGQSDAVRLGDVTGDRQTDIVEWNAKTGDVLMTEGSFRGFRNDSRPGSEVWATIPYRKGDRFVLADQNNDGRADLWIIRSSGAVNVYRSDKDRFTLSQSFNLPEKALPWENTYVIKQRDGSLVLAGTEAEGSQLYAYVFRNGSWLPVEPLKWRPGIFQSLQVVRSEENGSERFFAARANSGSGVSLEVESGKPVWKITKHNFKLPFTDDEMLLGDYNGDGLEDVIVWNRQQKTGTVFQQTKEKEFVKLSSFGPWGDEGGRLIVNDFDGNGKADLGMFGPDGRILDIACSFESQ